MSKKIIAIALFATMLLSLVPFASAATSDVVGIQVLNKYDINKDVRTMDGVSLTPNAAYITGSSFKLDMTALTKGKFSDIKKYNEQFNGDKAIYIYRVFFNGPISDVTVNGSTTDVTGPVAWDNNNDGNVAAGEVAYYIDIEYTLNRGGSSAKKFDIVFKQANNDVVIQKSNYYFWAEYQDSQGASKASKSMDVSVIPAPATTGDYNAYFLGGVLFIDYANTSKTGAYHPSGATYYTANGDENLLGWDTNSNDARQYPLWNYMEFQFYSDGNRLPVTSKNAYLNTDTTYAPENGKVGNAGDPKNDKFLVLNDHGASNQFVSAFVDGRNTNTYSGNRALPVIKNDSNTKLRIRMNPSISSFKMVIEDENYVYSSPSYKIQWTAVPRNEITNVTIASREVTVEIGETKTLDISPSHATTYYDMRLVSKDYQKIALLDGVKVTGLAAGESTLTVEVKAYAGDSWKAIDAIRLKVVAKNTSTPIADANIYRVVVSGKLNVRSGPGTSYPVVAQLTQANTVEVVEITADGWAKLSNGTYVSAKYLVKVAAGGTAVGNYVVTASRLNVRSAPNGTIIGKLTSGTPVTVIGFSGSWAQLSTSGWVSSAYLKAI